jgi:hypothetical protein
MLELQTRRHQVPVQSRAYEEGTKQRVCNPSIDGSFYVLEANGVT